MKWLNNLRLSAHHTQKVAFNRALLHRDSRELCFVHNAKYTNSTLSNQQKCVNNWSATPRVCDAAALICSGGAGRWHSIGS